MATAKKGLRRIVVDGRAYAWRIRRKATYLQADYGAGMLHVAVQGAENPASVLVIHTSRPHPADWGANEAIPITPSDVAAWIRQAISRGWDPSAHGPQNLVYIAAGPME